MEVNIAGRRFCHLADYLFNEEQGLRAAPWMQFSSLLARSHTRLRNHHTKRCTVTA